MRRAPGARLGTRSPDPPTGGRVVPIAAVVLPVLAVLLTAAGDSMAVDAPAADAGRISAHAGVAPASARLGQPLLYRGWILVDRGTPVTWATAKSGGAFAWGAPRMGRERFEPPPSSSAERDATRAQDRVWVEVPLQVFHIGRVSIPGLEFAVGRGVPGRRPLAGRLPVVFLDIVPTLAPADSNAQLRELHGPLAAPWWERVPWVLVGCGALLAAAVTALVLRLRRRRPLPTPAVATAADPRAVALAALAALRRLTLPEQGRFAEHAFRLGQILRHYLEATMGTTQPGDTTPELIGHLRDAALESDDLQRLSGLLRVWDRVKFARAPLGIDEARQAEVAVETFVRRGAPAATTRQVA